MSLFVLALLVAIVGVVLFLLGRLFKCFWLAGLGVLFTILSGGLAFFDHYYILGILWIVFSLASVIFAGIWLYKNKRWAFWFSFGSDAAIITAAATAYTFIREVKIDDVIYDGKDKVNHGPMMDVLEILNYSKGSEGAKLVENKYGLVADKIVAQQDVFMKEIIVNALIPVAVFVCVAVLGILIFNKLIPAIQHRSKNELKHKTNIDPLIGTRVTICKEKSGESSHRGLIGDVDWAIEPLYSYEKFKEGDVVKVRAIKGVTLYCTRDGKDFREEMRDQRKAKAEEARKKREAEKARKAAEKAKKAEEKPVAKEEPKPVVKEEPKPEVKEEPKVVEEVKPVEEPAPAPAPAPVEPVVEEAPAPKKEKPEFIPFAIRLKKSDSFVKEAYNELKSEVLSYGIKSRVSSTGDTFRLHKKEYVKMVVAGKYLKLYLALNPADYKDTTYPFEDASRMGAHSDTPFVFKIKSGLSVRRAKVLIADAAKKDNLVQGEVVKHNHAKDVK